MLTTLDPMICQYSGNVVPQGAAKLQVLGAQVLTAPRLQGSTVAACKGAASSVPVCSGVSSVQGGQASKLFVSGEAVLLPSAVIQSSTPPPPGVSPPPPAMPPHSVQLVPGSPRQTKLETT
ncbi:hypothetical protein [Sabulicella rubraurantiaca]|uniref:hypothetical protein n=1 Tax=Sabulicella rubraurantiaca TaxID=2811429 RepID=UPI001A9656C2|nr:hypothetical protein [Sabulicella rubraurantiaca]